MADNMFFDSSDKSKGFYREDDGEIWRNMERDIKNGNLESRVDNDETLFDLRYIPIGKSPETKTDKEIAKHFFYMKPVRAILNGVLLGERSFGEPYDRAYFDEEITLYGIVSVGKEILEGEETTLSIGDNGVIPLRFEPIEQNKVRISTSMPEDFNVQVYKAKTTFGDIAPVILDREEAAFRVLNYHTELYNEGIALITDQSQRNELIESQKELHAIPNVTEIFRKYNSII